MSFNKYYYTNRNLFFIFILVLLLVPSALFSQITLTVGETSGEVGDSLVPLDIHISNQSDTIAGYQIWLQMSQPDMVKFQHLYDTSSFIVSNWSVGLNSLGGQDYDILVSAFHHPIIPDFFLPPQNNDLLIRLYLKVADSFVFTPVDSVVNIYLQTDFIGNFSFAKPTGESIGLILEEVVDTNCFVCTAWVGENCLNYMQVAWPNVCDSVAIDTLMVSRLDTTFWQFNNGSFTLLPTCGVSFTTYDISDLVALVSFMFGGGPVVLLEDADCNCDCEINIADLICFVDYMFNSGPAPGCDTH